MVAVSTLPVVIRRAAWHRVVELSFLRRPPEDLGELGRSTEDIRDTEAVLTPVWSAIDLTDWPKSSRESIWVLLAGDRECMMMGEWNQEGFSLK